MNNVKQVIVVRKDLRMRRGKVASYVAHVASKFLVENNEAERGDELHVKLSPSEAEWLRGPSTRIVLGAPSEEAMKSIIFKAEMAGIDVHSVSGRTKQEEEKTVICVALGPDESNLIDQITGHLKSV